MNMLPQIGEFVKGKTIYPMSIRWL